MRDIVVFEIEDDDTQARLDFRHLRGALPSGACPLAIADRHEFAVAEGQWFAKEEVASFAERESGYRAEEDDTDNVEAVCQELMAAAACWNCGGFDIRGSHPPVCQGCGQDQ